MASVRFITGIFLLDNPWVTCRQLSMKSPHFTRLVRPKAPLTWLLCLSDNVQYTPLAAKSLSVMAGLPGYLLGSAWTFLLSTPHTTSLLSLHHHLPLTHLPPTSSQLRTPILPVPPLFHAETCLERDVFPVFWLWPRFLRTFFGDQKIKLYFFLWFLKEI